MSFTLFDVLLIAGIIQGVVAVPVILLSRERHLSGVFLALAIASLCCLFIKIFIYFSSFASAPSVRYLPIAFELSTGPLLYLYLRALTEKHFVWRQSLLLHFVPMFIAQTYALMTYLMVVDCPSPSLQDYLASELFYHQFKTFEDWAIVISIVSYLYLGYKKFTTFQTLVKNSTADSAYPTLSWLHSILVLCAILFLLLLLNMLLSRLTDIDRGSDIHWKVYYIYAAGVVYYLGLMAFRQQLPDLDQIYDIKPKAVSTRHVDTDNHRLIDGLKQLLEEEKLYLNPTLNLRQIADRLSVSPATLSSIINQHFNKSFRELINDRRLIDVKHKLLNNPQGASVLSLALESGFNSEASFYRIFRDNVGATPKAFVEKNQ